MKILVINCGSSSIKYQLFNADLEGVLAKGIVAKIGEQGSYLSHQAQDKALRQEVPVPNHRTGFELIVQALLDKEHGVLEDISEVSAVGHRTVHGADAFIASTLVTPEVIEKMEECIPLAPLHNPPNLLGIREAQAVLPDVPHVAVFDTAFHQTMPPQAFLYALPYEYYQEYKIRKYGFHGTSFRYVGRRAAHILGRPIEELKMVICHLGNGVSVAAVDGGKSIDTSMGLTPVQGLMMGTRSGDIDAGVIFFLNRQVGLSVDRIDNVLNRESGLLGVSGTSNDMRVIEEKANAGDERCRLAMKMFAYRVRQYIGAYAVSLGGLDALVFTAGIGENSPTIRNMVCEPLGFLGLVLDEKQNSQVRGTEAIISTPGSKIKILVVPTNEERMIALDTITVAGLAENGPAPAAHAERSRKSSERR